MIRAGRGPAKPASDAVEGQFMTQQRLARYQQYRPVHGGVVPAVLLTTPTIVGWSEQ